VTAKIAGRLDGPLTASIFSRVNKSHLVQRIVDHLLGELDLYFKAARAAHAEATHEQSKAENKYDTRGLEASYLARGQSRQAAEIEQAILQFQKLPLREFAPTDPIDLGAFVELQTKRENSYYFIGPRAGGTEVTVEDKPILVITPQSPLGQQLVGKMQGDRLQLEIAGSRSEYRIVSIG
jgi:transcription elongation GreA/GreB family factor